MDALLSPASLARNVEALAAGAHLQDPFALLSDALDLLQPPERISTVDCAERYRRLPGVEGGAIVRYDRWQTPYNVGPMNSLDDPKCRIVVIVKPSRSGGTTVAENYLFKMAMFGPMGHISWYLDGDESVIDYCRNVVKAMFDPDLNPGLAAKVGTERGDDTDSFKRVRGYPVEWLAAKDSTLRNREPVFMVSDETDAWKPKFARTPKIQIEGRQKRLGNRRKAAIMSHPDLGMTSGVAATYEDSTRGIYIMKCLECLGFAAAYATKFWPEVPQFKLDWDCNEYAADPAEPGRRVLVLKREQVATDRRLDLAEETARMLCPHCGVGLTEAQRREMVDAALRDCTNAQAGWMHRGQWLDAVEGVLGEMINHPVHGFWEHGLMLKAETMASLARAYEEAKIDFERTKDPAKLKELLSKKLGEVFEGAATTGGVSASVLKKRVRQSGYSRGTVPDGVKFIVAAVDTGGRYFDVAWTGYDLEGRSWLIDRLTIRQRRDENGEDRDLDVKQNIDDWMLLIPRVAERLFPLASNPEMALPVAVICIDSSDGNVTPKAREFAMRALKADCCWHKWPKFKLIKGAPGNRPPVAETKKKVETDELNKEIDPRLKEYTLGVDGLKELIFERLAVTDGGPGQCYFPMELEDRYVDEFFGELLIAGKWVRVSQRNESLDLYAYSEAGRQIIKPDRKDIKWEAGRLPMWAKPVRLNAEGGDQAAPASEPAGQKTHAKSKLSRFEALNRTGD